jgi:hypothetical protein
MSLGTASACRKSWVSNSGAPRVIGCRETRCHNRTNDSRYRFRMIPAAHLRLRLPSVFVAPGLLQSHGGGQSRGLEYLVRVFC